MSKAKPVEAKREPFALKHVDEAKEIVFSKKRSIRFVETVGTVRGVITVSPTDDEGADIKLQVFPIGAKIAKSLHVPCADAEDFPFSFMEARKKILAKMEETSKARKKYNIK